MGPEQRSNQAYRPSNICASCASSASFNNGRRNGIICGAQERTNPGPARASSSGIPPAPCANARLQGRRGLSFILIRTASSLVPTIAASHTSPYFLLLPRVSDSNKLEIETPFICQCHLFLQQSFRQTPFYSIKERDSGVSKTSATLPALLSKWSDFPSSIIEHPYLEVFPAGQHGALQ